MGNESTFQRWANRIYSLHRNLREMGLFLGAVFYINLICDRVYSYLVFERWDISVVHDARVWGAKHMKIGKNFRAGKGTWLEAIETRPYKDGVQQFAPKLIIGDDVSLSDYVHIGCAYHIEIGNHVLMGSKIYITDHNHGVYWGNDADSPATPPMQRRLSDEKSVIIGDNTWIGEFVTVLPGVNIGRGSIIGSHTVVTHDIPDGCVAVGNPAKVIKKWHDNKKVWERV